MTQTYPLELPFRGERPYLHGTDLHEAVMAALSGQIPEGPVSLTFHSLLKNLPDLVVSTDSLRHLREDPAFRGELRLGAGEVVLNAVMMESNRPVTERKVCNENDVAAAARMDAAQQTATLVNPEVGNLIESIVFLNKRLHLQLLPHLSPKWLFARLELSGALPSQAPSILAITLKQVLGNRFTRSEIFFDGRRFGSISFSTPQ